MNNPINAPQSPDELVLRLIGGERDGQLFTVQNEKCLLTGLFPGIVDAENYRCVIFRGEKGVAYRSYSDHVLCNGAKVSVQWLKKGDLIKLTDRFSVEVYQLGIYTKKPAAAPTASRGPVQTVEIPSNADPAPSTAPPVGARPTSTTLALGLPEATTSPASVSAAVAPKFKPATENLRTPAVTAPLATHQVPAQSPAPAPSVSRMPVVTQAIDTKPKTDSSPENEVEDQSLNTKSLEVTPSEKAPSDATIDSHTDRLSKLVESAGSDGNSELENSESIEAPTSSRPSVSTMVIQPTTTEEPAIEKAEATQQASTVVQPEQPSVPPANTGRQAAPTILSTPPAAPVVEAAHSGSETAAVPEPTTTDSAAHRRSALESYFSKTGVSLSDTTSPPVDEVPLTNAVSPEATPVEPVAAVEPAAPVTPSTSVEYPVPPTDQPAAEAITESPEFNLDSVLAKLESGSTAPSSQTPAVAPSQDQQHPVAAIPVAEVPAVETPAVAPPVVETLVAKDTLEQSHVAADNKDESSSEATNGDQGGQLKSFALLQSLGLDTSGLGQSKEEISEAPSQEAIESIASDEQQPEETQASEPAKVESVADVLARMQNAGSLQDFKAGEEEAESSALEITRTEAPTPAPVPEARPTPTPESSTASGDKGKDAVEDDGSVEDYMSQLLNRMRSDDDPTSGEVAEQKQDQAVEKIAAEQQEVISSDQPAKVQKLTQEEFVPQQKAFRMQGMDELRAIANSNAREAFRDSLAQERKVRTETKFAFSLVSLLFAVLFFLMSYMTDKVNFGGVVFGIVFLALGLYTGRAYLSERKLDRSILSD